MCVCVCVKVWETEREGDTVLTVAPHKAVLVARDGLGGERDGCKERWTDEWQERGGGFAFVSGALTSVNLIKAVCVWGRVRDSVCFCVSVCCPSSLPAGTALLCRWFALHEMVQGWLIRTVTHTHFLLSPCFLSKFLIYLHFHISLLSLLFSHFFFFYTFAADIHLKIYVFNNDSTHFWLQLVTSHLLWTIRGHSIIKPDLTSGIWSLNSQKNYFMFTFSWFSIYFQTTAENGLNNL